MNYFVSALLLCGSEPTAIEVCQEPHVGWWLTLCSLEGRGRTWPRGGGRPQSSPLTPTFASTKDVPRV